MIAELLVASLAVLLSFCGVLRWWVTRAPRGVERSKVDDLRRVLEQKRADRRSELELWEADFRRLDRGSRPLTTTEAARELQLATGALVDGVMGPLTEAAVKAAGLVAHQRRTACRPPTSCTELYCCHQPPCEVYRQAAMRRGTA